MKYSENNKPLECIMTQSSCYKGTTKMEIKGILWHSTGINNTTLKRYVQPDDNAPNRDELIKLIGKNKYKNDYNHKSKKAGLNAWIGKLADGTVAAVQTLPWDYRPWGVGKGSKGSCNDGWIQFEICEDNLTNPTYFNAIYKEACELTAYLCEKFGIDPNGTAELNGVKVPTILCHKEANTLKLGSKHADVLHWFSKHSKTMANVRADVANLIPKPEVAVELYRVRKSAGNAKSQKGAFKELKKAKACCQAAGEGYHVFNSAWEIVYSYTAPTVIELTHIEVSEAPTKTTYFVGEEFDPTGMEVVAVYSNADVKIIKDYTIFCFDSTVPGPCEIVIAYENSTTTFPILIEAIPEPDPQPEPEPDPQPQPEPENNIQKIIKIIKQIIKTVINLLKKKG